MDIQFREQTFIERVFERLGTLALVSLALCLVVIIGTGVYPWNPITRLEIKVIGAPTVGDDLLVQIDYCKTRPWAPKAVKWSLVNDISIVLPETMTSWAVGCDVRRLLVPTGTHILPGIYQLQEILIYDPFPWRGSYQYVRRSKPFVLLPKLAEVTR